MGDGSAEGPRQTLGRDERPGFLEGGAVSCGVGGGVLQGAALGSGPVPPFGGEASRVLPRTRAARGRSGIREAALKKTLLFVLRSKLSCRLV